MIENPNDAISFVLLIGLLAYIVYLVISGINYRRLERHIRSEQRYYKEWLDEEEAVGKQSLRNGGK